MVVGHEAGLVAQIAAEEVAREGGIDGVPLEIVAAPHSSPNSAAPAISIAEEFARDPTILAVIGHTNSAASLAASPIYNKAGLVQIAPTSTAPGLRLAGPYTFTMLPDDSRQAEFLAKQVEERYNPGRLAIIYVNDDYGRGLFTELRTRLDHNRALRIDEYSYLEVPDTMFPNGKIARSIELSGRQFGLAIERMMKAPPHLIVWLGRPAALGDFRRMLPDQLRDLPILGSDALDAPLLYDPNEILFHGVRFVRMTDPEANTPQGIKLRESFQSATSIRLSTEAMLAYDAVRVVVRALREGAHTRAELRDMLARVGNGAEPYNGASGIIRFDAHGQVDRTYHLAESGPGGVTRVGAN